MALKKIPLSQIKQGMVIMQLDKPGILFDGFGKPVFDLSIIHTLEKSGVKNVFVMGDSEASYGGSYSAASHTSSDSIKEEPISTQKKSQSSSSNNYIKPDKETLDYKQLTVANDMLEEILDHTSNAFGNFFDHNGAVSDVNVEIMASVVYDAVAITRSTPELFAKIISSEGESTDARIHATHVCIHSAMLANALGIGGQELIDICLAGLLHDCGLAKLPKEIVESTEALSEYALTVYQKHPILGEEICTNHPRVNENVTRMVAMHHEHIDGSGYPGRISAPYIPRGALIVGIAEAYNSMLMRSPDYVMHFNRKEAMRMLYSFAGTKYPKDMVKTFINIMGVYPVGTVLMLNNGMHAIVVAVNQKSHACPKILMFPPNDENGATFIDLSLHKDITILKELNEFELKINPMQIFIRYIYSKLTEA